MWSPFSHSEILTHNPLFCWFLQFIRISGFLPLQIMPQNMCPNLKLQILLFVAIKLRNGPRQCIWNAEKKVGYRVLHKSNQKN